MECVKGCFWGFELLWRVIYIISIGRLYLLDKVSFLEGGSKGGKVWLGKKK